MGFSCTSTHHLNSVRSHIIKKDKEAAYGSFFKRWKRKNAGLEFIYSHKQLYASASVANLFVLIVKFLNINSAFNHKKS